MNAIDIARDIIRRGYKPIPIPLGAKGPRIKQWQLFDFAADIQRYFGGRALNCGVQMGACSKNLADADLDCAEAVALAPYFLPPTNSVYGRPSKRRSHHLYICPDPPSKGSVQFKDENQAMILELRVGGGSKAAQSIWPCSTHTSGEPYEWDEDGAVAQVAFADWHLAAQKISVATILMRHWPAHGGRHDAVLVVGGFLARLGLDADAVADFVEAVVTEHGEPQYAVGARRTASDAVREFANGGAVCGLPKMIETFGEKAARQIAKILGYRGREAPDPTSPDSRPVIMVTPGSLSRNADEAEQALIDAEIQFYERSNGLVRPIVKEVDALRGGKTKAAQLATVCLVYMRDLLGRVAHWVRFDAETQRWVPINPPTAVAATVLARAGEWAFPSIAGIITTPTLRPGGTVLDQPGFDPDTRLLLIDPPEMEPIPDNPTKSDAVAALDLLKGLIVEFSFVDGVSRAVMLSALITPVARGAFPVAPMHTMDAPVAASGKSFFLDIVAAIATGQPMPVISTGKDEQECEKRLGSALLAGQSLICIDNISGALSGDCLCQIIERPRPQVRILGKSEMPTVETRGTMLFANGNNLLIVGDLCRRVVRARLDPNMENPELRVYKHDPLAMIAADRGAYVRACLVICRAYAAASRPEPATRFASFEAWSDIVRSALIWLGEADPVASMVSAKADDPERASFRDLLLEWAVTIGTGEANAKTLGEVIEISRETDDGWPHPALRHSDFNSALHAAVVGNDRHKRLNASTLSYWLRGRRRTIVGQYRFDYTETSGVRYWFVEPIGGQGQSASASAQAQARV